jgi:hypothetical protein
MFALLSPLRGEGRVRGCQRRRSLISLRNLNAQDSNLNVDTPTPTPPRKGEGLLKDEITYPTGGSGALAASAISQSRNAATAGLSAPAGVMNQNFAGLGTKPRGAVSRPAAMSPAT